jgi:hypothetical protein
MEPLEPLLVTTAQACKLVNCCRNTFDKVWRPRLTVFQHGTKRLYSREQIAGMIRSACGIRADADPSAEADRLAVERARRAFLAAR